MKGKVIGCLITVVILGLGVGLFSSCEKIQDGKVGYRLVGYSVENPTSQPTVKLTIDSKEERDLTIYIVARKKGEAVASASPTKVHLNIGRTTVTIPMSYIWGQITFGVGTIERRTSYDKLEITIGDRIYYR